MVTVVLWQLQCAYNEIMCMMYIALLSVYIYKFVCDVFCRVHHGFSGMQQ